MFGFKRYCHDFVFFLLRITNFHEILKQQLELCKEENHDGYEDSYYMAKLWN